MSRRGAVIGAATAALALFALVAMHGLPFTGAAPATAVADETLAGASHHAVSSSDMAHAHAVTDHAVADHAVAAATSEGAGSPAPHTHSVWHLCLAVLVAFAVLALAASEGRRIDDLIRRVRGRWVRLLESRALDPPTQAGLCLLRC